MVWKNISCVHCAVIWIDYSTSVRRTDGHFLELQRAFADMMTLVKTVVLYGTCRETSQFVCAEVRTART